MKKYIKLLFASTQSQVRSKRGVAMTKTRRLLMTAAATSCLVAAGGCYHYYVNGGNVFPVLMAAETAASVNSEISDETERRRKCSQLVKQFKVMSEAFSTSFKFIHLYCILLSLTALKSIVINVLNKHVIESPFTILCIGYTNTIHIQIYFEFGIISFDIGIGIL